MLLRPVCHRAVQRQLHPPTDSIWISDEALHQAFRQFSRGSKVCRRYGSYVPGPLEARRRMGKRKMTMTLQSDPSSMPASDPGLFGGWFGAAEKDRTQWKWEAPYIRVPTVYVQEPDLPPWLSDFGTPPSPYTTAEGTERVFRPIDVRIQSLPTFKAEEVAAFRSKLEASLGNDSAICDTFIQHIKQSLILGTMPDDSLKHVLAAVPDIIMHQRGLAREDARSQCLLLYQSIWDGIESCKVQKADFLHGKTMQRLFGLICRLPMTAETQQLCIRLIHAASSDQIVHMKRDLPTFIITWIQQQNSRFPDRDKSTRIPMIQQTVSEVHLQIENIHRLHKEAVYRAKDGGHYTGQILMCQEAKRQLRSALDDIRQEELAKTQITISTPLLEALAVVPADVLCGVLRSALHHVISNPTKAEKGMNESMQFVLLLLAAQMPAMVAIQFQAMLKAQTCHLKPKQFSRLLLEHWISQGYLKVPSITRNTWQILMDQGIPADAALLQSIFKNREMFGQRLSQAIYLWHDLDMRQRTYKVILELLRAHVAIPPFLMNMVLESVSGFSAKKAHELWTEYQKSPLRGGNREYYQQGLRLEYCHKFVVSLIQDPWFKSGIIWSMLGMDHGKYIGPRKKKFRHYRYVEMITRMAIAFAHSPRPSRERFRHISVCVRFLQDNHVPITSDVTRSLVLAGVTDRIRKGMYVPDWREAWIWELVRRAEGDEVADASAEAVRVWNRQIQNRQIAAKAMEEDWFRVKLGPID